MSNTHVHVSSLDNLKKELEQYGLEKLIQLYSKYECLIGDSDSIKFLEEQNEILKKIKNKDYVD